MFVCVCVWGGGGGGHVKFLWGVGDGCIEKSSEHSLGPHQTMSVQAV